MKTYICTIQERSILSVEVRANNPQEAEETALDMHHQGKSDFVSIWGSEVTHVDEQKKK